MVDPERFSRAVVFYLAAWARGQRPRFFGAWLMDRLDEAAGLLLAEDVFDLERGAPPDENAHGLLSRILAVPMNLARRVSVRFNGLNHEARSTFFCYLIEGNALPELPERTRVVEYMRSALEVLYDFREKSCRDLGAASDGTFYSDLVGIPKAHRQMVTVLLRHYLIRSYEAAGCAHHKNVCVHQQLHVLRWAELQELVHSIEQAQKMDKETTKGLRLLANGLDGRVSLLDLGRTAAQLQPDHVSSIHLAQCCFEAGAPKEALDLLAAVTKSQASDRTRSYAWQQAAYFHWSSGNLLEAKRASRRSTAAGGDRPGPAANWLLSSCLLGDRAETIAAAKTLDEMIQADHCAIKTYVHNLHEELERHRYRGKLASNIVDHAGSASREIMDVLV